MNLDLEVLGERFEENRVRIKQLMNSDREVWLTFEFADAGEGGYWHKRPEKHFFQSPAGYSRICKLGFGIGVRCTRRVEYQACGLPDHVSDPCPQ